MFLGIFTTLLVPETKRKTLEQLAGEVPGTPEYDPRLAGPRASAYDYEAQRKTSDSETEHAHMKQEV